MRSESRQLTRDELYELVWSKPTTRVAMELGISDVMVGKLCRKLGVPKPKPGHWRKVGTGQRVPKPPLPRAQKGQQTTVWITPQPPSPAGPPIAPDIAARLEAEQQAANRIVVPAEHALSHALVMRAQQVLDQARVNVEGLLQPAPSRPCLAITVAPASLLRVLRLMDVLLLALEQRGYTISVAADEGVTWVRTPEGGVQLRLAEHVERKESETYRAARALDRYAYVEPAKRWTYRPDGQLTITMTDEDGTQRAACRDTATRRLENQLNRVVAGIIRTAEECRLHRIERAEAERQRQERERREREEAMRRYELQRLSEVFEKQAAQWLRSEQLRSFLQACEQAFLAARSAKELAPDSPEAIWLRWARDYVQHLDPLANGAIVRAAREVAGNSAVRSVLHLKEGS